VHNLRLAVVDRGDGRRRGVFEVRQLFPSRHPADAYELSGAAFDKPAAKQSLEFDSFARLDNPAVPLVDRGPFPGSATVREVVRMRRFSRDDRLGLADVRRMRRHSRGYGELAAELGCSEQVIRQHFSRGLKRLRALMNEQP
jgi:hypothetical protein